MHIRRGPVRHPARHRLKLRMTCSETIIGGHQLASRYFVCRSTPVALLAAQDRAQHSGAYSLLDLVDVRARSTVRQQPGTCWKPEGRNQVSDEA
jgi:hypothetical protein